VPRNCEQVEGHRFRVDGNFAKGLHRVAVKDRAFGFGCRCEGWYFLQSSDFVVDPHDADDRSIGVDESIE